MRASDGNVIDIYAATIAFLCLLHCLALPILVSSLSLAIPFAENETVHKILVLIAAPASLFVLFAERARSGWQWFMVVMASGLILLLAAAFVPKFAAYEQSMTVAGSVLLASAHLWRARHRDVSHRRATYKSAKRPPN